MIYLNFFLYVLLTSVADPWNFCADPDPRIHTPDYWIMDPDPAIVFGDLQNVNKICFFQIFVAFYFLKVHLHRFSKIKSHKEVTKQ